MTPQPVYTAEGKFYPATETGELLPSVSTVLSVCFPNYGVMSWAKREVAAGRNPSRHANRGTELHAIAAAHLSHHPITPSPPTPIQPWLQPLLNGLRAATDQLGPALATETYIEAPWYAGTMDALLESGTVLDIKTVQTLDGWNHDAAAWATAPERERRAWLQVLGYCNAADLADEELCSGVTQGALLIVSPEAFRLKRVQFSEEDLQRWCGPEGDLFLRYGQAVEQRQQRQAALGERGDIAAGFGFS